MKALIQKEIIRKPIMKGEDIDGKMESETIVIRIFGIVVFKQVIQLSLPH